MPRGSKASYTNKQRRQASHIEEGYEKRGVSDKTAAARAWATVNKESGGGKKLSSSRTSKKGAKTNMSPKHKTSGRKNATRTSSHKAPSVAPL